MSTIEEFENAPVGATASSTETNARYIKSSDRWLLFDGRGDWRVDEYGLESEGFTLDPVHADLAAADQQLQALTLWTVPDLVEALAHGRVHIALDLAPAPAPTTSREALDLAWELAHPVKAGQTIPPQTECIQNEGNGFGHITTPGNWTPVFPEYTRTLDPLPEPEPDWLDAPAVTADCLCSPGGRTVYVSHGGIGWTCSSCDTPFAPEDMENVTPLYPKEDQP